MKKTLLTASADVILIVPPFVMTNYQSLAAHVLQGVAQEAGFRVRVFYANIHYAAFIGDVYSRLCESDPNLSGERLFAPWVWEKEIDSLFPDKREAPGLAQVFYPPQEPPTQQEYRELARLTGEWLDSLAGEIAQIQAPLVGFTCSTEQINASFAMMKRIKALRPEATTLFGGYSAEGEMARGIASLDPAGDLVDYIFSGESEGAFTRFLSSWHLGNLPDQRIIKGKANQNLEALPPLDYRDYFTQLEEAFPGQSQEAMVAMESSRGCWWGEKSHCLFCGYSEERLAYRQKSGEHFQGELKVMEQLPSRYLHMADLIMPWSHFKDLVPELQDTQTDWTLYYEQRAAWDRPQLEALAASGFRDHQPGIESLSTSLLKKMGKASTLARNLRFLRDSLGAGLKVYWNFVWGFPGETIQEYREMIHLMDLISHLPPPIGIFQLSLSRFSPLYEDQQRWGIINVEPLFTYKEVLPPWADLDKLAYYFTCRVPAETCEDPMVIQEFVQAVDRWNSRWENLVTRPRLMAARDGQGQLILLDTRNPQQITHRPLNSQEARDLIQNRPFKGTPFELKALDRGWALHTDGQFVPLVTVDTPLYKELMDE